MASRISRWGLIIPWAIFALMVAGWTAYWFALSGETLRQLDRARAGLPDGGRLSYASVRTEGFPFRMLAVLRDARLDGPDGGYLLASPEVSLAVNVLNPRHLLVFAQNPIRLQTAALDWTITADRTEASLRLTDKGFQEVRLAITKLRLADPAGGPTTADLFAIAAKPDPAAENEVLVAVNAQAFQPGATKGLEGFANAPGQFRAGLVLEGADLVKPGRDPLSAWAQAGARLRIDAFEGRLGEVSATAKGAFTLDPQRRWQGAVALDFADVAAGLRAVAGSSLIEPRARAAAQAFAQGQGLVGGALAVTIRADDGRWRLGPIDLGPVDPLYPLP